ncbi:MAG: hypothetical protein RLY71_1987 [Pseudomonadota bacterium]|jgi:hypothetical protein
MNTTNEAGKAAGQAAALPEQTDSACTPPAPDRLQRALWRLTDIDSIADDATADIQALSRAGLLMLTTRTGCDLTDHDHRQAGLLILGDVIQRRAAELARDIAEQVRRSGAESKPDSERHARPAAQQVQP